MFSKLTVHSVIFLGFTAFTVAIALLFKNPLLVYTAVFLVTVNLVLYVWAQFAVRGLSIRRRHPRLAVATLPLEVKIELTNQRRTARYGTLGFDLHQRLTPGQDYTPVAFLEAHPGLPSEATYNMVPVRRGVFPIGPFYLYGGDPFGFYKCWRKLDEVTELTVLPRPVQFRFTRTASVSHLAQDELETVAVPGNSTEFLGVRDYRDGEPLRRVHWASSARLGKLISRQYELNVAGAISTLLLIDEHMVRGTAADNPLEYSLTMVASLAHATCRERFHLSYLALLGKERDTLSGTGEGFYQELAVRLARLEGHGPVYWEQQSRYILGYLPAGSSLLVFVANLDETARLRLRHLAAHYRSLAVITFNRQSFETAKPPRGTQRMLSFSDGYFVQEVAFGDDLANALELALARCTMMQGPGSTAGALRCMGDSH